MKVLLAIVGAVILLAAVVWMERLILEILYPHHTDED
jgi:hypothetical protein